MRILISNDDGVYAPGLAILAEELSSLAEIIVMAPDRDRSGASNSLTLDMPIRIRKLQNGFISVQGTPTDCVHLALTGYLKHKPDLIVSGINDGANLGDDVIYSGTVAVAIEARIFKISSLAISLVEPDQCNYKTAAMVAKSLVAKMLQEPSATTTTLNVNVPDVTFDELNGFEITRLGVRHTADPTVKMLDPRKHTVYWVGPPGLGEDAGQGTDFGAIAAGCVAITPLHIDLTNYEAFEQMAQWTQDLKL